MLHTLSSRFPFSIYRCALFFLTTLSALAADKATPPAQPATGPGGADITYAAVTMQTFGEGDKQYWIFTPDQPKPDKPLPLIIFTHGWGAMEPAPYMAWIHHLVGKGNIVVYPRYQASLKTPTKDFTANAIAAVKSAIETLQKEDQPVKPQLDLCAVAGHSVGGLLAANLAVEMPKNGLPTPKAVLCVEPGKTSGPERFQTPLSNLNQMNAATLLLVLVGDSDRLVKDDDGKRIYAETTAIPAAQKNLLELVSDDHGEPGLVAGHIAPCAPLAGTENSTSQNMLADLTTVSTGGESADDSGGFRKRLKERLAQKMAENPEKVASIKAQFVTNTLDYYATWKLLDALTDAAFYNKNRDVALGGTAAQTSMGNWSDGTPVHPLKVLK